MTRRAASGSSCHGVSSEKPSSRARVWIIRMRHDLEPLGQGAMAPAAIERSGSAITFSSSTPRRVPSPEHSGQAP